MNLPQAVAGRTAAILSSLIRKWSGRGAYPSPKQPWNLALPQICSDLEALNRSTEEEFLSVGARLQELTRKAREVSKLCSEASTLLSGRDMMSATEGLHSIHHQVSALESSFHQKSLTFNSVFSGIERIQLLLEDFTPIIRELSVLCVSTKIESMRLGERDLGFAVLSEEVKKLGHEMAEQRGRLLEKSHTLKGSLKQISDRVLVLEGPGGIRWG
jgi:hypothetical protein